MSALTKRIDAELEAREPLAAMFREHRADLARRGRDQQLIVYAASFARARVYCGEWIADCPREDCNNAEFLTDKPPHLRGVAGVAGVRRERFMCSNCFYIATSVHWPDDADDLMRVLDRRPVPGTRNWYPEGHPEAVLCGKPDGQSVAELLAENREHGVL